MYEMPHCSHLLDKLGIVGVVQGHGLARTGLLHDRIVSQLRRHVLPRRFRWVRCGAVRGKVETRKGGTLVNNAVK